jgi:hypothetical protein
MITADLEALKYQKKKDYSNILEKELNFITADITSMSKVSALLAGFSFAGIINGPNWPGRCDPHTKPYPNDSPGCGWSWGDLPIETALGMFTHDYYFEFGYVVVTVSSMYYNLALLCYSTCLAIFGPNSALHVHNEAFLEQVLISLREDRRNCLQLLAAGVFFFAFSHLIAAWYRWRGEVGFVLTIVIFAFYREMYLMYDNMHHVYNAPSLYPKYCLRWWNQDKATQVCRESACYCTCQSLCLLTTHYLLRLQGGSRFFRRLLNDADSGNRRVVDPILAAYRPCDTVGQ